MQACHRVGCQRPCPVLGGSLFSWPQTHAFLSSCRNLAPSGSAALGVCVAAPFLASRHLEKTQKEPQKFNGRGERADSLLTVGRGMDRLPNLPWYKHFCGSSSSCFQFPRFPLTFSHLIMLGVPVRRGSIFQVQRGAFFNLVLQSSKCNPFNVRVKSS